MNYDKIMHEIIASLGGNKPNILLHSCCAPCSSAVIERLFDYFNITIIYYNPNIEPLDEYLKRKEEQKKFIKKVFEDKISFLDCDYDNEIFRELVKNNIWDEERGPRCKICYRQRIEYTAKMACAEHYDFFGTTLTVSPYKLSSWINEIGGDMEKKYNVKFLYSDFKKNDGYKRSIELSKIHNLYRQNYCGCIYSQRKNNISPANIKKVKG